ncbi:MAG: hypothetical protein ACR2N6_05710 [Miltoncostaeaceae bacterium]
MSKVPLVVGRFARWLRLHPDLAEELRGGPVGLVLQDAGRIVLRSEGHPDFTVSVRGFDLRGPEPADPLAMLRPDGADLRIALAPDAGAAGWAGIGDGDGAVSWSDLAARHRDAHGFAVEEGLIFPDPLPDLSGPGYPPARDGLHRIAEVLGAARQSLTGRFGLRARANGVTTPGFPEDAWLQPTMICGPGAGLLTVLPAPEGVGVALEGLSARGAAEDLMQRYAERGVELTLDVAGLSDEPSAAAPKGFGTFLSFGANALARARYEAGPDAGNIQLWPEHFDQAFDSRRVTCGVGPGDEADPEPYLYVLTENPGGPLPEGAEWREDPWSGAMLHWRDLRALAATGDGALAVARAFYAAGLATRA